MRVIDPKFVYLFYDYLGYPRTHLYSTRVHTNFFQIYFAFVIISIEICTIKIAHLEPHLTDKYIYITINYSSVPNRRAVRSKRAGGKILEKYLTCRAE